MKRKCCFPQPVTAKIPKFADHKPGKGDAQQPPSESQPLPQRKQMAGTKM